MSTSWRGGGLPRARSRVGSVSFRALARPSSSSSSSSSNRRSSFAAPAILQHDFPSSPGGVGGGATSRFKSSSSNIVVGGGNNVVVFDPPAHHLPPLPPSPLDDTSRDGWHRDGSYRLAMSPRPHEIDEFGVVNNTRYQQFMYAARYSLFDALGAPVPELQSKGINGVTSKVCTTFRAPLRLGERFYATSGVLSVSTARVVLVEEVRKCDSNNTLVASSEVTCAFVDGEYKPIRLPAELRAALERGAAMHKAAAEVAAA